MHTVKEAALMTGLTEHAVRFYTDKGLVPSLQRNENNIRLFDAESINWLYGVKCLKQSGMPIEIIKMYVDLCLEGDSLIWNKKPPNIRPYWSTAFRTRPIPANGIKSKRTRIVVWHPGKRKYSSRPRTVASVRRTAANMSATEQQPYNKQMASHDCRGGACS